MRTAEKKNLSIIEENSFESPYRITGDNRMMKRKHLIKIVLIVLIGVLLSSVAVCVFIHIATPPDRAKIEEMLSEDLSDYEMIVEFLNGENYSSIMIGKEEIAKNQMKTLIAEGGDVKIQNTDVEETIRRLFNGRKCYYISKRNGYASFEIWKFFDESRGIVYYLGDIADLSISYITNIEKLSIDGWYYYEVNYNKWRESK